MKIVHLTSVHPAFDPRIFHKECRTLAAAGHEVVLVAPHDQDETCDGVRIRAIQRARGRLMRFTATVRKVYQAALAENAAVYHFHDPELLPAGLLLAARGHHVVYDAHEDVPANVLTKAYLPTWVRAPLSRMAAWFEHVGADRFGAVVAATPVIASHFPPAKTFLVQNFAPLDERPLASKPYADRPRLAVYAGVLAQERGARELVAAMDHLPDVELALAGRFWPLTLQDELAAEPGWARVTHHGWLGRPELSALYGDARVGVVTLRPLPTYMEAQPTKLYEYMAAGLPVVASNFPMWREIVEGAGCGLLVDPLDPAAIAGAITWLLDHPEEAEAMGRRGAEAAATRYNWEQQAQTLLAMYETIAAS